jgi:glycosyltransferase involved in cell wall biosynthesis
MGAGTGKERGDFMMRIINIVDRLDKVNFGIWNAAIATAKALGDAFEAESEIWYPEATRDSEYPNLNGAHARGLEDLSLKGLEVAREDAGLDPSRDMIVSHGCWRYPTRWGLTLKKDGFAWMAVPHGMLERWSLGQKPWRKRIYYAFKERPALRKADRIRAVGKPEYDSLVKRFGKLVVWVPNGVGAIEPEGRQPIGERRQILFMARLHHKKGLIPLLQGWMQSKLGTDPRFELKIAGPDDGELARIEQMLKEHSDALKGVELLGPVYGEAKEKLLFSSHYYILPSYSEGFPTSVLEAMQHGCVPLISRGCNFPDVFTEGLGELVEPSASSVAAGLNRIHGESVEAWQKASDRARFWIEKHYRNEVLADSLMLHYSTLLASK